MSPESARPTNAVSHSSALSLHKAEWYCGPRNATPGLPAEQHREEGARPEGSTDTGRKRTPDGKFFDITDCAGRFSARISPFFRHEEGLS
jgi:hypothetical protein